MLSPLRNRFGIPGVISVIALVFAMLGGAYAASNEGGGKATASAKKGPRGPRGPKGPAGPAGPAGPQGPAGANGAKGDAGAKGDKGDTGSAGAPGSPGASGKSVTVTSASPTQCNELGGAIVKVEGAPSGTEVCNGEPGEKGEDGEKGDPWSAGGTLPPGATETGAWAFNASSDDGEFILAPISFPIPLAAPLGPTHVHFQGEEGFAAACPGDEFEGFLDPKANPGELCVYFNPFGGAPVNATFTQINPVGTLESSEASRTGAILRFTFSAPEPTETARGFGSWAVTG